MAEHDQQFDTFEEWCNKASSWLTRHGEHTHAICYDAQYRLCTKGGDFMRARDEGSFPVKWVWPDQVTKLLSSQEHMLRALKEIHEGSNVAGRWLDADGEAIDGYNSEDTPPPTEEWPDATWEPYTDEEQDQWISTVADTAGDAIEEAEKLMVVS